MVLEIPPALHAAAAPSPGLAAATRAWDLDGRLKRTTLCLGEFKPPADPGFGGVSAFKARPLLAH